MIFICIPVHNRLALTRACIKSIKKQNYSNYKIIICDDGSTDDTYEEIKKEYPEVVLVRGDGNLWWTGATNKCVAHALKKASDTDLIFTLNNDTELAPDCLSELIEAKKKYPNSIIGCVNLFFANRNKIEPSSQKEKRVLGFKLYLRFNKWGDDLKNYAGLFEVNALSGKGVLVPIVVLKKIGVYNYEMLPHYHADTEFTIRASKAGYKVFINYSAKIYSHQNESGIGTHTSQPNIKEFIKSFSTIKSTHHFQTLINYSKLIYNKYYRIYFLISLFGIILGFIKRYCIFIINKYYLRKV